MFDFKSKAIVISLGELLKALNTFEGRKVVFEIGEREIIPDEFISNKLEKMVILRLEYFTSLLNAARATEGLYKKFKTIEDCPPEERPYWNIIRAELGLEKLLEVIEDEENTEASDID